MPQTVGMDKTPATFWNLSNHPIGEAWSAGQIEAARGWEALGLEPRDWPFPAVDPEAGPLDVRNLAEATVAALLAAGAVASEPVLVMGEFSLVWNLVGLLAARGLVPVTATTRREASQLLQADGSVLMAHQFRFVRFRRYEPEVQPS